MADDGSPDPRSPDPGTPTPGTPTPGTPTPGTPDPHPPGIGAPEREGSPTAAGAAPPVHTPSHNPGHTPSHNPGHTPGHTPSQNLGRIPSPSDRRSMQVAVVAVLAGVMLAVIGAGQAWATISAGVELPGIGAGRVGAAELTGNDLGPYGALALLGLVLLVAVAATRGRGRWVVGVALVALGGALVAGGLLGGSRAPAEARERAWTGYLAGVSTGTELQVARSPAGPALVVAGGLLLAAAGAEALRRGRSWPALGDAFRAPPDRVQPATGRDEPPWEGD